MVWFQLWDLTILPNLSDLGHEACNWDIHRCDLLEETISTMILSTHERSYWICQEYRPWLPFIRIILRVVFKTNSLEG